MYSNSSEKKITVPDIQSRKKSKEKISALTAYDFPMASLLDETGIDLILVGDSLAMVVAGYENTLPVTMDEMIYHTRIVSRAVKRALLVADMPFLSYQPSLEQGITNAGRFLKEANAEAVKIEGGEIFAPLIEKLVKMGIPVMGHLGLLPQSIRRYGSYKVQGKEDSDARRLLEEAKILEQAGVFSMVLEKIPAALAAEITGTVSVPTIGIGAGPHCDGQILVSHDMLGIFEQFKPKFARQYADLGKQMRDAFKKYIEDVRSGHFPGEGEYFT